MFALRRALCRAGLQKNAFLIAPIRNNSSSSDSLGISEIDEELASTAFATHQTSFTPSTASKDADSRPVSSWIQPDEGDLASGIQSFNHRQLQEVKWNVPDYTIDERAVMLMAAKPLVEPSESLDEAHRKSRAFYRLIVRKMPSLLMWYNMTEVHPMKAARSIRTHFEKYRGIKDVTVLDKLRWHGEVVLSDVVRNHFTYSHAYNLLNLKGEIVPVPAKGVDEVKTDFLSDFFVGGKTMKG